MHALAVDQQGVRAAARRAANLAAFEDLAKARLLRALHYYVAGYAEDGAAHRRNLRSLRMCAFVPNVLTDVSQRSTVTSLFGVDHAVPFGIAPMGFSRQMADNRREVSTPIGAASF